MASPSNDRSFQSFLASSYVCWCCRQWKSNCLPSNEFSHANGSFMKHYVTPEFNFAMQERHTRAATLLRSSPLHFGYYVNVIQYQTVNGKLFPFKGVITLFVIRLQIAERRKVEETFLFQSQAASLKWDECCKEEAKLFIHESLMSFTSIRMNKCVEVFIAPLNEDKYLLRDRSLRLSSRKANVSWV